MIYSLLSAAGNRFAVVDTRDQQPILEPGQLAIELCAGDGQREPLDGLLLVGRGLEGGDCRMTIHNADGSRPEACGNGLRCVALFAREKGFALRDRVRVETDAGPRTVDLLRENGMITSARASMGRPRVLAQEERLSSPEGELRAILVDMGNPHCVLFVQDERVAPVQALGAMLEVHPRFPRRTNVEFVAVRAQRLHVRVWERGVGETAACGTGACASAVAASISGRIDLPVDVVLPGGTLRVAWDGSGEVELTGPCTTHARDLVFEASGRSAR